MTKRGYKNPPEEHQFKKGKSGNPKGRPRKKKAPNPEPLDDIIQYVNEEWVDKPERTDTTIDIKTAKKKASDIEQQIASISVMFEQGQFEKVMRHVDRLKKKIRTMRQAGLDTEAMEFSPENIAFKLLRRNDLLDTLTKLKYKAYDQSMTLDD